MMSDKEVKVEVSGGGGWIAIALIFIALWGEPNLLDCVRNYLIAHTPATQETTP